MSLKGKASENKVLKGRISRCNEIIISAYHIAVKNGFKGTEEEWLASLKGENATEEQIAKAVSDYMKANPTAMIGGSWNDLTDKPFCEEVTEVGGDTLTWDGNTDGRVTTGDCDEGFVVKVSDAVPTIGDFVNGVSIILNDGSVYNETYETIRSGYEESGILSSDHWIISPADDFNFADYLFFPEAGVYFLAGDERAASFTLPGYTGFVSKQTVVKTIDPKFLPEALQFGETTVMGDTLTWDGNTEGLVTTPDGMFVKLSSAVVTVNDVANGYKVGMTFDGQYHEWEADEVDTDIDGMVGLGDGTFMCAYLDNVAVADFVFPEKGIYVATTMVEATPMTLTIPGYTGFETTTVKPLDEKYLPILTSPGGKKFKLSVDDSGTLTATEV